MKKKALKSLAIIAATTAMTSCSTVGMVGGLYQGTTEPTAVTSNEVGTKVGTSGATSVLGIVAVGDAGVNAAAKNGAITKVSHVDTKTTSVLGLFTSIKTFVYGE